MNNPEKNTDQIPSGNTQQSAAIDPSGGDHSASLNDLFQKARDAMRDLAQHVHMDPNDADALFEITSMACEELGLLICDYPELLEARASKKKYLPCICAVDPELLPTGLYEMWRAPKETDLKQTTKKSQRRTLSKDEGLKGIFRFFVRRFLHSITQDDQHASPTRGTINRSWVEPASREKLLLPENRMNTGLWATEFVKWVKNSSPHVLKEPPGGEWDRYSLGRGGWPEGTLWAYAMMKRNAPGENGNLPSASYLGVESIIQQGARDLFRTLLTQKWSHES